MLWYGSIATIPSGWHLCDGTMGTPDLKNRMVRGAGEGAPPDSFAGTLTHKHPFTGDGHLHTIPEGTGLAAGTDYALETTSDPAVGETDYVSHMFNSLRLCYIMKL